MNKFIDFSNLHHYISLTSSNMVSTLSSSGVLFSLMVMVLFLFHSPNHSMVDALLKNTGFKIDLIHRDSPLSPFYDPTETNSNRLTKAVLRSKSRINHLGVSSSFSSQTNSIQSDLVPNVADYLMKFSLGTPPIEVLASADTGSDLIWTQCKPCVQCYQQNAPLFDSQQSSTYKDVPCDSNYCKKLPTHECRSSNKDCLYSYGYFDNSYTVGVLANDTFAFAGSSSSGDHQSIEFPNVIFGCGHSNDGTFSAKGSGLVGLGGGPLSLVSQLAPKIGAKFSYCLAPMFSKATSKLNLGSDGSMISNQGMVSTPLLPKDPVTIYFVKLEGISFGDQTFDNAGTMIVDSGTTLTYLVPDLYDKLEAAVKGAINLPPVQDQRGLFNFCYNTNEDLMIPETTIHFTGADLKLSQENMFIRASDELLCFTMDRSTQESSVWGNMGQVNFQIQYDLEGKKISFAPTDCTKF